MWPNLLCWFFFTRRTQKNSVKLVSNYLNQCPRFFICPKFGFFLFFRFRPIAAHSAYCFSYMYVKIMKNGSFVIFSMQFCNDKCGQKHIICFGTNTSLRNATGDSKKVPRLVLTLQVRNSVHHLWYLDPVN
jgi:hypothetical protein